MTHTNLWLPALAGSLLIAAGCTGDPVASGDAYAARGQLREAVLEYRCAIERQPDAADVHYKLALAYERLGEIEPAARALVRVTELAPGHRDAGERAARHVRELRRRTEAKRRTDVSVHLANSNALLAAGDVPAAQDELERARERGAASWEVDAQQARFALARRVPAAAVPLAEKAAAQAPGPATHALLARALRANGDLARARTVLERAARGDATSGEVEIERGYLALAAGRAADARQAVDRASRVVAGTGQDAVALAILAAQVEVAERRPAAARAVLADLVARAPYNPDAVEAFAELLAVIGETDAAIEQYARAAALRPGAARTWTSLGMLRQQRGDAAGAQDAYERTLAIDPRHGVAANNLAWLYADAGRLEEAERLAGLAWRALRAAPQVRDTLARIQRLKGQSPSGSATTRE